MPRAVLAVVIALVVGVAAVVIARSLGHPWMHVVLIGLGAGCTTLALGLWWASSAAGRRATDLDDTSGSPPA